MKAKGITCVRIALIALAGYWVFSPALHGDWLWNDKSFLAENGPVRGSAGLWRTWLAPQGPDYCPLKTTVQWIQWRLWGMDPFGYHLTNVGLHLASALLLWRGLRRLGMRFAWLGGLLLVVHPVAVESVARIPDLGAALSLALFLTGMLAWMKEGGREKGLLNSGTLLPLACFLLAMLSDAWAAMFPAVLLLCAWWKRGRITREDWRAAEPFLAILLLFAAVTLSMGLNPGADAPVAGFFSQVAAAGLAVGLYLLKSLVPVNLIPIHPHAYLPLAILIGLGVAALGGFFNFEWKGRGAIFSVLVAVAVAALAGASRRYARVFSGNEAFWSYTLDRDPDAWLAQYNLGLVLVSSQRLPEAIDHFEEALRLKPDYAEAQSDLAVALCVQGRTREAIPHFEQALQLDPDNAQVHYNFGLALRSVGRPGEAAKQWEEAARLLSGDRSHGQ